MTDDRVAADRGNALRCPICRAMIRGVCQCGRCGADLTAILKVREIAWTAREAGRVAFVAGHFSEAMKHLKESLEFEENQVARRLSWLAENLMERNST
ncbi:MAG: hypothetical protein WA705_20575 [Candidatus Ozemobacteraceae bacterium]